VAQLAVKPCPNNSKVNLSVTCLSLAQKKMSEMGVEVSGLLA